jgi:hypothetical protein
MNIPGWSPEEQAALDDLIKRKEIVTEMFLRPIREQLVNELDRKGVEYSSEAADALIGNAAKFCQILQPLIQRKV